MNRQKKENKLPVLDVQFIWNASTFWFRRTCWKIKITESNVLDFSQCKTNRQKIDIVRLLAHLSAALIFHGLFISPIIRESVSQVLRKYLVNRNINVIGHFELDERHRNAHFIHPFWSNSSFWTKVCTQQQQQKKNLHYVNERAMLLKFSMWFFFFLFLSLLVKQI